MKKKSWILAYLVAFLIGLSTSFLYETADTTETQEAAVAVEVAPVPLKEAKASSTDISLDVGYMVARADGALEFAEIGPDTFDFSGAFEGAYAADTTIGSIDGMMCGKNSLLLTWDADEGSYKMTGNVQGYTSDGSLITADLTGTAVNAEDNSIYGKFEGQYTSTSADGITHGTLIGAVILAQDGSCLENECTMEVIIEGSYESGDTNSVSSTYPVYDGNLDRQFI